MGILAKRDIEDILALTPMQAGILFHYFQAPGSDVYFEQLSLEISGKIDLKRFEEALNFVIESNEMLRTVFRWEKLEAPIQIILNKYKLQPRYYDFTGTGSGEMKKRLEQLKANDRKSKFQLQEVPFRVILCKVKENKYVMIVSNHHILYDGWSTGIILKEIFTAYHDLSDGKQLVKPIKTKFKNFIQWLQEQDFVKQEKFWRHYLKNFDTQTGLSVKSIGKEKAIPLTGTKNCQVRFEKDIKDKLDGFVKSYRITLVSLLYSAWGILLQKYNNTDDVVFGTTVSGRGAKVQGIEDMVGLFINTIPLRVQILSHEKSKDLLYRIDKELQKREKYEITSLVKIREYSDFAYNEELFDSIVVIENYPLDIKSMQGNSKLFIESHSMVEWTHYDLTISITIADDIQVNFSYNNKLFDKWIIERLSGHFVCIVQSMMEKPGEEVSAIELIGEEEKRQILIHFNKTGFNYSGDQPIDELFARQVSKIPDYIALVGMTGIVEMRHANTNAVPLKNEVSVTYRELNERANQLAYALKEKGVLADTIAGIIVERFIEMIIGIMGILKAGGAYLPIDPGYPLERINYMFSDSRAAILLTTKNIAKAINFDKEMIYLDASSPQASLNLSEGRHPDFPFSHLPIFPSSLPSSLAYVIYTSGSTGNPKGVMVEHRNVNYLVYGLREKIYKNYRENLKVCLVSPFVFDASVKQIFGALLLGNCLCIVPEEARINGGALFEFYKKHQVDISDGTPAHLQLLMGNEDRDSPGVRNYLIGGEPLSWKTAHGFLNRFADDDPGITNVYGPTECTVDAASYQVNRENIGLLHTIPIGNPLPNCRIYVLDRRNKLQPVGVPGELCIMGKGVSRGYLNRPELTAEKFIKLEVEVEAGVEPWEQNQNPKSQIQNKHIFYIYKTGDLCRWLPKGNIEFRGRLDQQVKIRGHRIELGEIEHQLFNYPGVKEAVVTTKLSGSGEYFLCAYFVSDSPEAIGISPLRKYLQRKLPGYMIPAYFVNLEEIPLTASGKVDRKSLPQPDITSSKGYVIPGNEIQAALVDIWAEILGIDKGQIGIDDNFFELGGHSLMFAGLIGRIHKKLNIKLPFIKIFKIPTIRELADYIRKEKEKKYGEILPVEKKEYYRLSSAQRRLFVLQQMDVDCTAYNITGVFKVKGTTEMERLENVFRQVIGRHESFRTSFHMVNDQPGQRIHDTVEFEIEYDQSLVNGHWSLVNCQGRGEVPSPIKVEKVIQNFIRPFDLSKAPLLRVGVIDLEEDKHILIVDMHHIISDGLSMEIFVKDFLVLYKGKDLLIPPVTRYKDYAEWETGILVQERLKEQKEYWRKQFDEEVPVLILPTDFSRPVVQDFAGHTLRFELSGLQTQALKAAAFNKKTTLNVVLLTLYTIFLSKISGQEDIVVGVPSLARPHVETETIIGMFANSLALRNFPGGEKSMGEFINEVKVGTLQAFAHQEYPYEALVETVVTDRDSGRNPLFDTMFVLRNIGALEIEIPGLKVQPFEYEKNQSKFDLTLTAVEAEENLVFTFEYCTKLFKEETIRRFVGFFKNIILTIIENHDIRISEIEIINAQEKNRLLYEFNDTEAEFPQDKTIQQLFEEQVGRTPDHAAVFGCRCMDARMHENVTVTYRELNQRSDQLAHQLRQQGVTRGNIVGLLAERSVEMVIGLYGILKSGGAYLPLAPDYPADRLHYMLEDSSTRWIVTRKKYIASTHFTGSGLDIEDEALYSYQCSSNPGAGSGPEDLLYVIYTSGSTGKPKGVPIKTRGFVSLVWWYVKELKLDAADKFLLIAPISFDLTQKNLFAPLITGGGLYLPPPGPIDYEAVSGLVAREKQTVINCAPSVFYPFVEFNSNDRFERLKTLRYIILGGEPIQLDKLMPWLTSETCRCEIFNTYGPTECTDVVSFYRLGTGKLDGCTVIPIGRPVDNVMLVILDRWQKLLPIGIVGEVCIGGIGLGPGYCNNMQLTAEKFIQAPPWCLRGKRLYRTGDLGRWLPEGNIEFLGRLDHQVKIRGLRIELEEIESHLMTHGSIKEAVVHIRENNNNDKYLCAYIVSDCKLTASALRDFLSPSLPAYMIPSYFVMLEHIPLTPSGKIDRKVLPEPDLDVSLADYAPPRDEIEIKLVEIWLQVLEIKNRPIGINDNFFQLGGHSLKATIVIAKINREFRINIPLTEMFRNPLIRDLAQYIRKAAKGKYQYIKPVEIKEYYVLSSPQRRLYFLQQMDEKGIGYNIPSMWILEGHFDKCKLENTFLKLIHRHESLRTSFHLVGDEPIQRIHRENENGRQGNLLKFVGTIPRLTSSTALSVIRKFIRPFDLAKVPLLRMGLLNVSQQTHILMVDMHHIISDATSAELLIKDFMALYTGEKLPSLSLQYKDYSEWWDSQEQTALLKQQKAFWVKEFEGDIPVLELPTDYTRPSVQSFEGSSIHFEIDKEKMRVLKRLTLETGTTLFIVLLAIYNIFLSKVSGSEDIVIGTPVAGRRHADLENIIGMFVNTLALRNNLSGEMEFVDFLHQVKEKTLKALENQEYQYEELVEQLSINRDISRNPLFEIMFAFQNTGITGIEIPGMKLTPYENENKTSKFDLTLVTEEKEEELSFDLEYCTRLFKEETIVRFAEYFQKIVSSVLEDPGKKISRIEIILEEEKEQILFDFNAASAVYPKDKTLHELFEKQVEKTPDNIALVGVHETHKKHEKKYNMSYMSYISHLSYKELNQKTNQLAQVLRAKGVMADSITGIMVERSIEMIIGILGILKAGGAYLPIEPDYPQERINYMLADSAARILVRGVSEVSGGIEIIDLYKIKSKGYFPTLPTQLNLAYIIYTSGSTGKPKGVLVEHRNLAAYIHAFYREFAITANDTVLQQASFVFDAFVEEVYPVLLKGGKLAIPSAGEILDIHLLQEFIIKNRVTLTSCSPLLLNELNRCEFKELDTIHTFISGGDVLRGEYLDRLLQIGTVYNTYGPTETTVCVTYYKCLKDNVSTIPIGKPISNYKVYILGKNNQLQPIGVGGELCVSGDGVTRGYLNNPELTAERFYRSNKSCRTYISKRIFRTGDLALWLEDGNIEFLGRMDFQVKIRGYRIELGEIENQLIKHSQIKEALVVQREINNGDNYLCAYIVGNNEGKQGKMPGSNDLRGSLSRVLPGYMIPSFFIHLDKIPLTAAGKIDRKMLPAPEIKTGTNYTAPRDHQEQKLVEIWSRVLGIEKEIIGIDNNFFQLGGHSLKAATLAARIHKELQVNVPLAEIFKTPFIRGLAAFVKNAVKHQFFSIEAVEKKEYYTLSSAQRRLFVLQQMDEMGIGYNMSAIWQVEGNLDVGKFEAVFHRLIQRHESLRTSFYMVNDEPVQRIGGKSVIGHWSQVIGKAGKNEIEDLSKNFIKPFDLSWAPLFRVGLLEQEEQKNILMIDMHHIISDGMSVGIFVNEFMELYAGKVLPVLKLQYKDYAEWHNRQIPGESLKLQEAHWLKEFSGDMPVLDLPTDYSRPLTQSFTGHTIRFEMDKEKTGALKSLAREQEVTLFMLLLSLYVVFLFKLSSQEDIVVGTPIAGRRHADLEPVIGMFVNILALRNFTVGQKRFTLFLEEVKDRTIKAFENQDYMYEDLVEKVEIERDTGRNPLFDTMFALQNIGTLEIEIPGVKVQPLDYETYKSKFDLTLIAVEAEEKLVFTFEYCNKLFKEETIQRFVGFFKKTILTILENHDIRISEIEIINAQEKNRLLYEFNDTETEYPRDKTIQQLFAEQVERTPDHKAVVGNCQLLMSNGQWSTEDTVSITYKELNQKTNQLGQVLRDKGVIVDSITGIMVECSIEMIIGMLAVLKAGGAYLPIEPDYPQERINYMLADSAAKILLTSEAINRVLTPLHLHLPSIPAPCLAYIIYTSGTTGKPKGVMMQHQSLVNLCSWHNRYFKVQESDHATQYASIGFDASVWEIFPYLIKGASLHIITPDIRLDIEKLNQYFETHDITIGFLPTPVCQQFMELENHSLRKLLTGGDHLKTFIKRNYELHNNYGPTENTVVNTSFPVNRHYINIPIGQPVDNNRIYILNKYGHHPQPIGISGELYIAGDGLARGYLNRPELTAEKFLTVSFGYYRSYRSHMSYIYKTGDLARWQVDGNIEFLGRVDFQVKIRGFRIELGEIENRLLEHKQIREAVVIDCQDSHEEKYLCAYIVPTLEKAFENTLSQELGEYLAQKLPDYMIPLYFVKIEKIPLNQSGKIDRKALPEPQLKIEEYIAPRNQVEEKLLELWSDVLGIEKERIGINGGFFNLGGHSLKAAVLVARIHTELDVKVPLPEFFKSPTIRDLSQYIKGQTQKRHESILPVEEKEYYPLSSAQKRLFTLQQMDLESTNYNLPEQLLLEGSLDVKKLENTFRELIRRHEILRTSLHIFEMEPVQIIHPEVAFKIEYIDYPDNKPEDYLEAASGFIRPFDLGQAPLMRVKLINFSHSQHLVMLDIHHIITDGISNTLFFKEFMKIYMGEILPPQHLRYKDYAEWQNNPGQEEKVKKQEIYWLKVFDTVPVPLELPGDYPRPAVKNFSGQRLQFTLGKKESQALIELGQEERATLYMVLLAILNILFARLGNQEDIVIGTPTAGRSYAVFQDVMGIFINMLVIRNYPQGNLTFREFLQEVVQNTLDAFENQDYQYEDLVHRLRIKRYLNRHPIFDIGYEIINFESTTINIPGITLKPFAAQHIRSKFDIAVVVIEAPEGLDFHWEYSTELFKEETILMMIKNLKNIINLIIENRYIRLQDIQVKHELMSAKPGIPRIDLEF